VRHQAPFRETYNPGLSSSFAINLDSSWSILLSMQKQSRDVNVSRLPELQNPAAVNILQSGC